MFLSRTKGVSLKFKVWTVGHIHKNPKDKLAEKIQKNVLFYIVSKISPNYYGFIISKKGTNWNFFDFYNSELDPKTNQTSTYNFVE